MRRRTLLASLASASAVLAGCQTRADDTPNATNLMNGSPTTEQPITGEPGDDHEDEGFPGEVATTTRLDTQPRTLSLFPVEYRSRDGGRVRLSFEAGATADHPARLRAELTNENDFSNVFRLGRLPPFGQNPRFNPDVHASESVPEGARQVYLAPLPGQSLPILAPDLERGPEGVWRLEESVVSLWLPSTHRLDSGESIAVTFAVVGGAGGTGAFEPIRRSIYAGLADHSLTLVAWNSDSPGPSGESRFEGESFPALPGEGGTAWFHDAGPDTAVFLRPSAEQTTLPADLSFTFVNHATEPTSGNPYFWALYKLWDGGWQKVAPRGYPMPMSFVAPGDTKQYGLRVAHGDGDGGGDDGSGDGCSDGLSVEHDLGFNPTEVGFLGGGTYAFEAGMSVGDRTHAAIFDVDAPPVKITPEDGVETSRDGGTVTATSPKWDAGHGRGVLTVTRADSAERVVLPEVAARHERFRNTLPFFEDGVTTVKLRTSDGVARLRDDQPSRFAVHGQAYKASSSILEE